MIRYCLTLATAIYILSCGPYPPPKNPYQKADDILSDLNNLRSKIKSAKIAGKVDHFGEKVRTQGKIYIFFQSPDKLRIEIFSPFQTTLSTLVVDSNTFYLCDLQNNRFLTGPATPCNIARFLGMQMKSAEVIKVLMGHTPLIKGNTKITWSGKGYYVVKISSGDFSQTLHIGPDKNKLPILRSILKDRKKVVFDIKYSIWKKTGTTFLPTVIDLQMPSDNSKIMLRYNYKFMETNVDLPEDAWILDTPHDILKEFVTCDDELKTNNSLRTSPKE